MSWVCRDHIMLIKKPKFSLASPQFLVFFSILITLALFVFLNVWQKPIAMQPSQHFLDQATKVKLKSLLGGKIRYTLDGTKPIEESPVYESEIPIEQSALLRMAVFFGNKQISREQNHEFFVETKHTMPVVSLVVEADNEEPLPDNFLKVDSNYFVKFNYFENNKELVFNHRAKLELHGESLRTAPQQSFRLELVDEDGNEQGASYPFFGDEPPTYFTSLVLRNDDPGHTHLREQVANQLVLEATGLDFQRGKPVVVYINGKYWGLYFLRDRFDETYFKEKYGLKAKTLGLIETAWGGDIKGYMVPANKGSKKDAEKFNKLLTNTARCDKCIGYSVANEIVDMENLVDYLFLEFYFANYDWPYNNYRIWRYQSEDLYLPEAELVSQLDGRFRWLFFDSDVSFGAGRLTKEKMVDAASGNPYAQLIDNAFPMRNIFYSPTFADRYQSKMQETLATTLRPENTDQIIDYWAAQIRPEMPATIERWKAYNTEKRTYAVSDMADWENQVNLFKVYLRERPEFFETYTKEFFKQQLVK